MCRIYSVRKQRETCYIYPNGSPYCDAEGSLQLRSFLHGEIINSSSRIGRKLTKFNCIDSVHLEEGRTHT